MCSPGRLPNFPPPPIAPPPHSDSNHFIECFSGKHFSIPWQDSISRPNECQSRALPLCTVRNKGFHEVFIVSLRENLFVVSIKTFSQKPSQNHCYERFLIKTLWEDFCEKVLMKTTKRFSLMVTMKTLRKPL